MLRLYSAANRAFFELAEDYRQYFYFFLSSVSGIEEMNLRDPPQKNQFFQQQGRTEFQLPIGV